VEEKMLSKNSVKAVRNNAFRALVVGLSGAALVMSLSACSPVSSLKSAYEGEPFPQMPAPEVATYVLDLSGSTYPTAQLEALGSGISDFIEGRSLGNPFAKTVEAPRGLSIQFITTNAAQAPRIVLVSTQTSQDLYRFVSENVPNLEGSRQLWNGLINARTQIWQDSTLGASLTGCIEQVIQSLGKQQLLPDALQEPARLVCQDAIKTANALERLNNFVANPTVGVSSDVEGAITIGLKNLINSKSEFPSARLTLVIASDLIDEVGLDLPRKLAGSSSKKACGFGTKDASRITADYSDVSIVLVGARNSVASTQLLDQVSTYWSCYFSQIGITNIEEKSDLSGF
jgi:hypothetical protein